MKGWFYQHKNFNNNNQFKNIYFKPNIISQLVIIKIKYEE